MAEQLEQRLGARRDFTIVLDEQDSQPRRRRGGETVDGVGRVDGWHRVGRARQVEPHRRARAHFAVDRREPPGALAEREYLRQPEARAHPLRLRREKRLERAREHLGRHAEAGILDRDLHEVARQRKAVLAAERDVVRADLEAPALRHRVAGVDREIDHRELELRDVDAHGPQVELRVDGERRFRAERRLQQLAARREPVRDVDRLAAQRLLARDAQQLARERLAVLQRALDRGELGVQMLNAAPPRDLHVARDDHQQVVEIVRDAADQVAERLHLARLPVRRFDRAPHRRLRLPALPGLLLRAQPLERQPDHAPQRGGRREHRDEQHAQVLVPRMTDRRRAVRARYEHGIAADLPVRDDLAVAVALHAHDARVLIALRAAERVRAVGLRCGVVRRAARRGRIRREHGAVGARERHRHRRVGAAEQIAIERVEIRRLQRDRHHPRERAVAMAPRDARIEHGPRIRRLQRPRHHARDVLDHLAVADADEIVALRDRRIRRRVIEAVREQHPARAEDRHRGDLRIAAADRVERIMDVGLGIAHRGIVEILHEIDDPRVERLRQIEYFQRMLLGDAHGAHRHVARGGLARAHVVVSHHRDVYARQHDRGDEHHDERHAPHREIVLRRAGRERSIVLPIVVVGRCRA
ncbi:Uncharacterised protein [Burkholderia pseudomallei]|nr:Uncharacterised protein [Burkholderia pseudomallei]